MRKWSWDCGHSFEKFSFKGELRTVTMAKERCGIKEKTGGLLGKCDRRKGQENRGVCMILKK